MMGFCSPVAFFVNEMTIALQPVISGTTTNITNPPLMADEFMTPWLNQISRLYRLLQTDLYHSDRFNKIVQPKKVQLPIVITQQEGYLGCGTNAIVMTLCVFNKPMTHQEVDKQTRRLGGFVAPSMMARFFKKKGLYARVFNRANFENITGELDNGNYVIPLHLRSLKKKLGHYEVINGYEVDASGEQWLCMSKKHSDQPQKVNYKDFEPLWSRFKIWGIPLGYKRLMIAVSANDDIVKRRGNMPIINWFATKINQLTNLMGQLVGA